VDIITKTNAGKLKKHLIHKEQRRAPYFPIIFDNEVYFVKNLPKNNLKAI
jgi:hypothetical protein